MDAIKNGMLATAKAAEAAARLGERLFCQNTPNVMNFNSQTCTSREQSERLLALGLKKETADCYWFYCDIAKEWKCTILSNTQVFKDYPTTIIPAWSLDRLKELYKCVGDTSLWNLDDVNYDRLIQCIGLAIKHNSFNKEYLV